MTVCKLLAQAQRDDDTIAAYELWDYGAAVPRYEITVSRDSIARLVEKNCPDNVEKEIQGDGWNLTRPGEYKQALGRERGASAPVA